MNRYRRRAVAALAAAGLLWGLTVPMSKLALAWLPPAWLTFARFGLAAAVLLAGARSRLRPAWTPGVLVSGAIGYGGSVLVQNAGITRTSVSHAALLIGATPVLVAIIAAAWHRTVARPVAWAGFAVSLAGVGLVTGGAGGGATPGGDALVLASLLLSAGFTVAQARLLPGRDPIAVTAVQFLAAAIAVLPVAVAAEGMPAAPRGAGTVLAVAGLAAVGTLLPFTLFAFGQSRVSAEVAGAFLNLEPLVGALAGVVAFGDPAGPLQLAGGTAILAGIALSSLPLLRSDQLGDHGGGAGRGAAGDRLGQRILHAELAGEVVVDPADRVEVAGDIVGSGRLGHHRCPVVGQRAADVLRRRQRVASGCPPRRPAGPRRRGRPGRRPGCPAGSRPAAVDDSGPEDAAEPADERRDVLRRAGRPGVGRGLTRSPISGWARAATAA
jgi:O-acetylserine/cysteine efflux transporter